MSSFVAAVVTYIAVDFTAAMFVLSIGMQMQQAQAAKDRQRRMEEEAAARADAAKGFQVSTEGEAKTLGVAYGRSAIAGVRVYHNTTNNYNFAKPAAGGLEFTNGTKPTGRTYALRAGTLTEVSQDALWNVSGWIIYRGDTSWSRKNFGTPSYTYDGASWMGSILVDAVNAIKTQQDSIIVIDNYLLTDSNGATVTLPSPIINWRFTLHGINYGQPEVISALPELPTFPQPTYSTIFNTNQTGTKHEYLWLQQALTVGEISGCYGITIDDRQLDDAAFQTGLRIHIYPQGGIVDPLIVANDSTRVNAKFTNVPYATCCFKLNRDEPQYHGVPNVKFFIEGAPVRSLVKSNGVVFPTTNKSYSNNPALCLLDYLTSTIYGKGLSDAEIDLESFYNTYIICERVVASNKSLDGTFWKYRNTTRNIKLFECNLVLDTNGSIRDNIELILETMFMAELVWSAGKYKLIMSYPMMFDDTIPYNYGDVVQYSTGGQVTLYKSLQDANHDFVLNSTWDSSFIPTINDSHIERGNDNSVSWPNAQSRLNFATVRFLNEAKDFAEDSVSWPPKYNTGINVTNRGNWNASIAYNKDDVVFYDGLYYKLGQVYPTYLSNLNFAYNDIVVSNGVYYKSLIDGNTNLPLTDTTKWKVSSPLAPSVDDHWYALSNNSIYNIMLAEDNNVKLETESFENGITDYYHALAKAEQKVRASRYNTIYSVKVTNEMFRLEPGDHAYIQSDVLSIPHLLTRVSEVKASNDGKIELTLTQFDASILAWNAKDDEIVHPIATFNVSLEQATNIIYQSDVSLDPLTAVTLSWTPADDARVTQYSIYYTTDEIPTVNSSWAFIGATYNTTFDLDLYFATNINVAVVSTSNKGTLAPRANPQMTDVTWPFVGINASVFKVAPLANLAFDLSNGILSLKWSSSGPRAISYEIRQGDTWDTATLVDITPNISTVIKTIAAGTYRYLCRVNTAWDIPSDISTFDLTVPATANITDISFSETNGTLYLNWPSLGPNIDTYEIRIGTVWDIARVITTTKEISCVVNYVTNKLETVWCKTKAPYGAESAPKQFSNVVVPTVPNIVSIDFIENGGLLSLQWPSAGTRIGSYEIRVGNSWADSDIIGITSSTSLPVSSITSDYCTVFCQTTAKYGIKSDVISFYVQVPTVPVLQNLHFVDTGANLLLQWDAGGVRADTYEIREGTDWSTASVICLTKETQTIISSITRDMHSYLCQVTSKYGLKSQITQFNIAPPAVGTLDGISFRKIIGSLELDWNAVNATDPLYEIRFGTTWDTPILTVQTRNLISYIDPMTAGDYHVFTKVTNKYGVESDISNFYITIPTVDDVSNFLINGNEFTADSINDPWLSGYKVKFNAGTSSDWNTGISLSGALIAGFPFVASNMPAGNVTFMVKAIDVAGNESLNVSTIITNVGDPEVANVIATYNPAFAGILNNCTYALGHLTSNGLDSFYGNDLQNFYGADTGVFYDPSQYAASEYYTDPYLFSMALVGSTAIANVTSTGQTPILTYREVDNGPFYGTVTTDPKYGNSADPFYGIAIVGPWLPLSQVLLKDITYQFRITSNMSSTQLDVTAFTLTVDAPDIVENVNDLTISSAGTQIPITKPFTYISNIQLTLQAGSTGAISLEVDKTSNLAPVAKAYNASHVAVNGAKIDAVIKGY